MPRFAKLSTPALLLATLAGCGDVASPEYPGEELAVVRGILVSQATKPLPEAELVIGWPDWSKGDEISTAFSTFVRLPVAATLPARFSASIFEPPPETAYFEPPPGAARFVGPRFASARILLARKGREVTDTSYVPFNSPFANETDAVLAIFDEYMLTYYDRDGKLFLQTEDGTLYEQPGGPVTKGFHLMRQDVVRCAEPESVTEDCIAENMERWGATREDAWWSCVNVRWEVWPVEVPLDTEITLTLPDYSVPEPHPPLCTTPRRV
jgi:hypothetical protein